MSELKALNILRFAFIFGIASATSCGKSHQPDGRVINGDEAHPGQFPFMVAIEIIKETGRSLCGGSLISEEWILTAAHCLTGASYTGASLTNAQMVHVYLGSTNRYEAAIGYAIWHTDFFIHPLWDWANKKNDIALIRIPATNSCDNIKPIPLPTMNSPTNYVGKIVIASGWGRKLIKATGVLRPPKRLQWTRVQVIENEICERIGLFVHDAEICLNVKIQGTPWVGDSGGPVFLENTGELIGVLTRTLSNNHEVREPVMAARVVHHLQWIKTVTGISQ